jgi:hypothetical protein
MPNPTEEKGTQLQIEQIKTDLHRAQQEGQLRAERIREILRSAISQATVEVKQGSGELREISKEAFAAVVETLQSRGKDLQDDLAASIQGIVEGISQSRRQTIARSEAELNQLQSQIEQQEEQLNSEIETALTEIDTTAKSSSSDVRDAIDAAIATLRDSEEAALLRKRYAQLQAQLSILKANLAARYGDRYEEMQHHLDNAKTWYRDAQVKAKTGEPNRLEQKQAEVEQKIGEAGTAIARKEKQVKQILRDLLHTLMEQIQDDKKPR